MSDVDAQYIGMLSQIVDDGLVIDSRNARTMRLEGLTAKFDTTPLISLRRTAWRSAIREMEWFMSGSTDLKDLHPSVQSWWKPFCKIDDHTLPHNYGAAFRRIYHPFSTELAGEVDPKSMEEIPVSTVVPHWKQEEINTVADSRAIHLGYAGINCDGDTFRVVGYENKSNYWIQFGSNGYKRLGLPSNFLKGIIKNPYYPSVRGVACYGVVDKTKVTYYDEAYGLWTDMINRCYDLKSRKKQLWYKDVVVHPRWKCFEFFLQDLPSILGFPEWLASKKKDSLELDKDYNKARYYGPDVCVFLPKKMNKGLAFANKVWKLPRYKLYFDQVQHFLDGIKNDPFSRRNVITTWLPDHVQMGYLNPTNCHGSMIQAFVDNDNKLDISMYQRSADMVVGTPHNWIQYWAFLLWVAAQTGREPGTFTWIGGDCHIYESHLPLVQKLKDLHAACGASELRPQLVYNGEVGSPFKADDFCLSGLYVPLCSDSAEMVV